MLSIGLLYIDAWEYYANLAAEDYYSHGGEKPGEWWGKGAEALGLRGTVKRSHLRSLFRGFKPGTEEALVQNAGRRNRRAGFDLTFNAPKPASVLIGAGPIPKVEVPRLHQEAVKSALQYLQDNLAFTRVGSVRKGECRLEKADILVAIYEHAVSRACEMHRHSHCLLLNLVVAEDQKTRCLHAKLIFPEKKLLGAWYRAKFAERLRKDLSLTCRREEDSFGISGVPKTLTEANSTRSKEIKAELRKTGEHGGKAAAKACLATRRTKQETESREKLHEKWRRECRAHGFSPRAFARIQRAKVYDPQKVLPKALARATKNLTRNGGHFSDHDMLYETLLEAPNWGIAPELIPSAVTEYLRTSNKVVRLYTADHERRYTTQSVLKSERRLLRNVEKLRERRGPRADSRLVAKMLAKEPSTTAEQIRAVYHLTQGRGSIRLVDGLPGTGKTRFVLKTCCEVWRKQGYRVIGATPTGKAACELEAATGITADTIHMHLCDFDKKRGFVAEHHLKQFVRAARGKPTYRLKRPKPLQVDRKTIVLVDEMGMVNTRHARMLSELVKRGGGVLIGTGDRHQFPPVEGSAPFQSLCNRVGFAEITDVRRQRDEWARKAVTLFREGRTGEALELYAERGCVVVKSNMDEALKQLVSEWTETSGASPETAIILAGTNDQTQEANRLCQQSRSYSGYIERRHRAKILDKDEKRGMEYRDYVHVGDRILFTRNDRRLKVRNGFLGTVLKISETGKTISVRLDHGPTIAVPVDEYPHLRLGYAITDFKFQGGTAKRAYVLAGGRSVPDRPAIYVQASRAEISTCFYTSEEMIGEGAKYANTPEKLKRIIADSPLAQQAAKAPDLRLAVDLDEEPENRLPAVIPQPKPNPQRSPQTPVKRIPKRRRLVGRKIIGLPAPRPYVMPNHIQYAMAQAEWTRRQQEKAGQFVQFVMANRSRRPQQHVPAAMSPELATRMMVAGLLLRPPAGKVKDNTAVMALLSGLLDQPQTSPDQMPEPLALPAPTETLGDTGDEFEQYTTADNQDPPAESQLLLTEPIVEIPTSCDQLAIEQEQVAEPDSPVVSREHLDETTEFPGKSAPETAWPSDSPLQDLPAAQVNVSPVEPAHWQPADEPSYVTPEPASSSWYPGDDFSAGISVGQSCGCSPASADANYSSYQTDVTSPYTQQQQQTMAAATYQYTGAAQTQATQQNQPATGCQTKPGGGPY